MDQITLLIEANGGSAAQASVTDPRLAVVTCMDARIEVLAVLGLHLGEAHVIRNADGRVTDDGPRSLALSSHVLGVDTVAAMQHPKCGITSVSDKELQVLTGAELGLFPIDDPAAASREDIALMAAKPFLNPLTVYDVESGELEHVAHGGRHYRDELSCVALQMESEVAQ